MWLGLASASCSDHDVPRVGYPQLPAAPVVRSAKVTRITDQMLLVLQQRSYAEQRFGRMEQVSEIGPPLLLC
jgi:hypothetical protein